MRRSLPLLVLLAAAWTPLARAQDFPPAPPIDQPKPFPMPASESYTLPNGLQVTLIPFGLAPKVIVQVRVDAGEVDAGSDPMLGQIAADMLKEGAGTRNAAQIAEAAAAMGGDLIVAEGARSTNITLNVLSEHVADAVALVSDVAIRPTFPADAFDRVKANALRNLSVALSQPGVVADFALDRALYPDHPYGAIPTPAHVQAYTLAQARGFQAAQFGAGRARLYVAGRFDAAATKAAIQRAFGGWARGNARKAPDARAVPGPQVILVDRPGAPQSTLLVNFPVPLKSDPDEQKLDVTDALLAGSFNSRITRNIREDKGYTYSPGSALSFQTDTAHWTLIADVTTEVTGASLHEVWGEIRRLQATPPSAEETGGTKTYRIGLFTLRTASTTGLLNQIATRDALGLPKDWLDRYVPGLLAVTPADVSAAAAKRFTIPTQTLVVVGDLKTVVPQLQAQPELKGLAFRTVTVP